MKKINLISESQFIQAHHFSVADFYGKETVVLQFTEQEFSLKSLYISAYDKQFKPLICLHQYDHTYRNEIAKFFCCEKDFFILTDKGTFGFESVSFVSKCHIEEKDDEFVISVLFESDDTLADNVREANKKHGTCISHFFNEYSAFY